MEKVFHLRGIVRKMGIDAATRRLIPPKKITQDDIMFLRDKAKDIGMQVGDVVSNDLVAVMELWGTQEQARRFSQEIAANIFSLDCRPY